MKYYIHPTHEKNRPDAGVKAVKDTYTILERLGYKPLVWKSRWKIHAMKYLTEQILYHRIKKITKPGDTILLQWPDYSIKYFRSLYGLLKKYRHVQILIHDINSLRKFGSGEMMEKEFFCIAETLIVHTPAMKDYVRSLGVKPNNIKILTSFDYLTDNTELPDRSLSHQIVYAGNLQKSSFLQYVDAKIFGDETILNCYGLHADNLGDKCQYKGVFPSEHVSVVEGSWGLVWDGDSVDTCSGIWGNYLKYNSPHKFSLYLVAGLPIIIWKKAALAEYVQSNNIGILVDSLSDIPSAISRITEGEYGNMLLNVKKQSCLLRQGCHLTNILCAKSRTKTNATNS